MGAKGSTAEPTYLNLGRDEINHMNELFKRVCQERPSKGCTYNDFLKFCEVLHPLLTQFIMDFYFGSNINSIIKTAREFSCFYSFMLRGSLEEQTKLMEFLLFGGLQESSTDVPPSGSSYYNKFSSLPINYDVDGQISKNKLENYLKGLICSYIKMEYNRQIKEFLSWRKVKSSFRPHDVDKFAAALHSSCPLPMTSQDIQRYVAKWRTVIDLHNVVYNYLFRLEESTHVQYPTLYPLCKTKRKITTCLMDMCSIIHLNSSLRGEFRKVWRLLYSSAIHGVNFQRMMERIELEGPTIVVIKDKKSHIFGGFASESWYRSDCFYGNFTSFMFQISPNLAIYDSSRLDENFQYVKTKSNPKGMGMGKGAMGLFGWWIEPDRLKGSCAVSCTTFKDLPILASSQKFLIENFEVWGVSEARKRAKKPPIKYHTISEAFSGNSSMDAPGRSSVMGLSFTGKYTDGYATSRAAKKWYVLAADEDEDNRETADAAVDSDDDSYDDDNGFEDINDDEEDDD